jgi:tyrosyl-tRNA synthetase
MNVEQKINLIKEVGEEIITEEDLRKLLQEKAHPTAYDGFEPSGRMHLAQGILRAVNVNKMLKAGCKFKMFVADWHAWANNKYGGDLDKIQTAGKYFVEIWKAAGMDVDNVDFVWSSTLAKDDNYWKKVMGVARHSTVQRIMRCCQIMGRKENEALSASQILYPCMQAADIFQLEADICQLGMDQRKVNILARELAEKLGYAKPVAVHHHMLMGLEQPPAGDKDAVERAIEMKMSKSRPDSAIFMDDSAEDVVRKISKAYCPAKQIEENPILEYCKYLLFQRFKALEIKRPEKFGGDLVLDDYESLAKIYSEGKLHPGDLKPAVAAKINELLEPVRKHFSKGSARDLMEKVKGFAVTR